MPTIHFEPDGKQIEAHLRPIQQSDPPSSRRHSLKTAWPTIPVAPKRITFMFKKMRTSNRLQIDNRLSAENLPATDT